MRTKTHLLALNGIVGGTYAALTLVASALNLAYGPVQFRFSEALTILPFLFPWTAPGLVLGCFAANLLSPYGPLDVVIGTLATLLAALVTQWTDKPWLALLSPVVFNGLLVGGMIAWYEVGFTGTFLPVFALNALRVAVGEAVVVFLLGGLLLKKAPRNGYLRQYIPEKRMIKS